MQYLFIMGKDTLLVVLQDMMNIHMEEGKEKVHTIHPFTPQDILPSVHEPLR